MSYRGTHFFPLSCSLVWRDRRREVGKTNEKQFVYGQRREKKKKSSRCDRQMKPPENTNSSVAGMIGKILGLRLYKRDSCTCCSSLPLERFFHEENYFCPILVQPLQEVFRTVPSSGTDIFPIFPALRFIRKEEKRNVRESWEGSGLQQD